MSKNQGGLLHIGKRNNYASILILKKITNRYGIRESSSLEKNAKH